MKNGVRKKKTKSNRQHVEALDGIQGSGNVYADIGFVNAEEMLAKAEVVRKIVNVIRKRGLTQARAAELLDLSQPKISGLMRGKFAGFSMDRLLRFLNALGQNVEIVIRPMATSQHQAYTHVTEG
jgi:predicted XRE-type DNA-binding protein